MTASTSSLELAGLSWLVVWTLTATAVWGAATAIAACLRRHSAHARHRVWAISMLIVLVAPVLAPALPVPRWWNWAVEGNSVQLAQTPPAADRLSGHGSVHEDANRSFTGGPAVDRPNTNERRVSDVLPSAPVSTAPGRPANLARAESAPARAFAWRSALVAIWLVGSTMSVLMLAFGMWRVRRMRLAAAKVTGATKTDLCREPCRALSIRCDVDLLVTPQASVPLLAGVFRPAIILPTGFGRWSADRLRVVLMHELIHLKRRDVWWEMIAQLAKTPTWFHPLAWYAVRRLRIERELACDDAVITFGAEPADYAEQLVEFAGELRRGSWRPAPVVAIAGASPIERRVRSILNPRTWRAPLGRWRTLALASFMASLVVIVAALSPTSGQEKPASPKTPVAVAAEENQIRKAIERGTAFLKSKQDPIQGTWPDHAGQTGGVTALCTLALLNSGVPVDDPVLKRSLTYLRGLVPTTTYVCSLQTRVFCLAGLQADRQLIQRNAKWLEETQIKNGSRRGSWTYPGLAVGGDNSNSQFALLGLYEAERAGAKVQKRTWQMTLDYWKSAQNASDGSFGYYKGQNGMEAPGTGSMTCAGIASLAVVSAMAPAADATIVGDKLKCCTDAASDDSGQRIRRALNWLSNHFTVEQNPIRIQTLQTRRNSAAMWHYYYLWDLAQACRLTGQRVVGDHDWYREGAAFLCRDKVQQADGGWRGGDSVEEDPNIATSFALLFISEGRRPLAIAKLQYGDGSDWNHHRHDAANLAHYVETKWRKDFPIGLSWQTIEIGKASAENLLESPVLFISGNEAPEIGDEQVKVLREYIDRGGYVFAEASCSDGKKFDSGFRELVKRIVPGAELKPLAGDHRIWSAEEAVPVDEQPQLLGIDLNGRTRIIYSPPAKDGTVGLSCCWELAALADATTTPPAVAARIAAGKSIGLNIVAYATDRKLRTRHVSLAPK